MFEELRHRIKNVMLYERIRNDYKYLRDMSRHYPLSESMFDALKTTRQDLQTYWKLGLLTVDEYNIGEKLALRIVDPKIYK